MPNLKVFTDSTSDLPKVWVDQYDIGIIPLYVVFGDEQLRDGVDITPAELYERVSQNGSLPKTAAPSPADFMAAFEPHVLQGDSILYISLSSELSATYQNALIAAAEFPDASIRVVDSRNLSSAIGLLVMKAVHAARDGKSLDAIVSMLETVRPEIETEFVIDTLEYLYKGGRCSGVQNLLGSLLNIRPVIKVIDGKMTPAYKVRGKKEKAMNQMLQNALEKSDQMDNDLMIVVHSFAEDEAKYLQKALQEKTHAREVVISTAGCVISSHCGPKTIGIMYSKKA
ncbi:DegV family EDD domain-containing protein [Paenibacillus sp. HJL G12]|uniref:DegV family EDD domain-containing protein n=1 Tax=Paenibacillus dendrobii TaxID=2691084 RepID=A0A7X3IIP4_9BACL|nr:DegV family protein [Paenibacillus dendrobii]MWV44071.1 DegV family EDD domain-containing protein [Paenibacillus dendrobii]